MELRKIIILLLFVGCTQNPSLKKVTYAYHHAMEEKYGVQFVAESDLRGKLPKITFDYCLWGEKDILEARILIHELAEQFLMRINKDEEMAKKFAHFPLRVEDLVISVSFIDASEGENHLERKLSHVTLLEGGVYYWAYDPALKIFKSIQHERF